MLLACGAGSCVFDASPRAAVRDDGGPMAKWEPPSLSRRNRIGSQQIPEAGSADAGSSTRIITSADAGMRMRDVDAGRTVVDAGQPMQRDAGAGPMGAVGSP